MGAINFSKGNYGNTIIFDSFTHPGYYKDVDRNVFQEDLYWLYNDFEKDIQHINSKISQILSKYNDFLGIDLINYDNISNVDNPIHIVINNGYYEGFSAYIDSDTNIKRDDYKTDEEYKKAVIDEYVEDANEYFREKYVDDNFTDKDFDESLNEYRKDLNIAFNQANYELVKLGKLYGMAILDQNGWVEKKHEITDKDVEIAKAKLDNQNTKEIDNELER